MESFINWTTPMTQTQRIAREYLFQKWAGDIERWLRAIIRRRLPSRTSDER